MKNVLLATFCAACAAIAWGAVMDPRPTAAAPERSCFTLTESAGVGGLWVQHRDGPGAMLVSQNVGGSKTAFVALEGGDPHKTNGFQFALAAHDGDVYFQIRDKDGKFHFVPVEALLKLADKDAKVKAPMGAVK